jgi:RNA polymerase subunit RPABC4/transcription elongation factor Spt4
MGEARKCIRCKRIIEAGTFCQACKSELLQYYEATKDWQMAFELESAQQSFRKYSPDNF